MKVGRYSYMTDKILFYILNIVRYYNVVIAIIPSNLIHILNERLIKLSSSAGPEIFVTRHTSRCLREKI